MQKIFVFWKYPERSFCAAKALFAVSRSIRWDALLLGVIGLICALDVFLNFLCSLRKGNKESLCWADAVCRLCGKCARTRRSRRYLYVCALIGFSFFGRRVRQTALLFGKFRALRSATRDAVSGHCELLKKFDQNFFRFAALRD